MTINNKVVKMLEGMIYATNRVMGVPCVAYDTVRIEAGFAQGKTCLKINLYGGQMFISVSWL